MNELLKEKREAILQIAAKHGARNVRVFGSAARGEADEESDLDLLVDLVAVDRLVPHLLAGRAIHDERDVLEAEEVGEDDVQRAGVDVHALGIDVRGVAVGAAVGIMGSG